MKNYSEKLINDLHKKRIEPEERMVGGKLGYAFHRFPIKGGISSIDVMAKTVQKSNSLLSYLKNK